VSRWTQGGPGQKARLENVGGEEKCSNYKTSQKGSLIHKRASDKIRENVTRRTSRESASNARKSVTKSGLAQGLLQDFWESPDRENILKRLPAGIPSNDTGGSEDCEKT